METQLNPAFRIAVLASGSGTNFESLARACLSGHLKSKLALLIVNRPQAKACERAKNLGIPVRVLDPKDFSDLAAWDQQIANELSSQDIDLVFLCGFLKKIGPQVLSRFRGKIINTHPSLLPAFGGPGMYGVKVHEAVIQSGSLETGITIHEVSEEYDSGKILAQKRIPVLPNDSPQSLEARLLETENQFVVDFIAALEAAPTQN